MSIFLSSRDLPPLGVTPRTITFEDDCKVFFLGELPKPDEEASNFEVDAVYLYNAAPNNNHSWYKEVYLRLRRLGFSGRLYIPEKRQELFKGRSSQDEKNWKLQVMSSSTRYLFWFPDFLAEQRWEAYIELCIIFGQHSHNGIAKKLHVGRPGKVLKNKTVQDWLNAKEIPVYESLDQLCKAVNG